MKNLNKYMRYQRRRAPKPPKQFEELEASALFCSKCKKAVTVRKKLLLALPEGDKYDYLCTECGSPIGSKITKEDTPVQFITK